MHVVLSKLLVFGHHMLLASMPALERTIGLDRDVRTCVNGRRHLKRLHFNFFSGQRTFPGMSHAFTERSSLLFTITIKIGSWSFGPYLSVPLSILLIQHENVHWER